MAPGRALCFRNPSLDLLFSLCSHVSMRTRADMLRYSIAFAFLRHPRATRAYGAFVRQRL